MEIKTTDPVADKYITKEKYNKDMRAMGMLLLLIHGLTLALIFSIIYHIKTIQI